MRTRWAAYSALAVWFLRKLARKLLDGRRVLRPSARKFPDDVNGFFLMLCFCKNFREYRYVDIGTAGRFPKPLDYETRRTLALKVEDTLAAAGYVPMQFEQNGYVFTGVGTLDRDTELVNGVESYPDFIAPQTLSWMQTVSAVAIRRTMKQTSRTPE